MKPYNELFAYQTYPTGYILTLNHDDYNGPVIVDRCDIVTGIGVGIMPSGEERQFFLPIKG